jgi:hypothetical protein
VLAKSAEASPELPALVATDKATPRRPARPNDDGQVGLDLDEEEEQLQEGDCWRELLLVVVGVVVVVAVTAPHLASPLDLDEELLLEAGLLYEARLEEEV